MGGCGRARGILLVMLLCGGAASAARAEVTVAGDASSLRLQTGGAAGATIEEALSSLASSFRFRFHSEAPLNRRIYGTFKGRLESVVSEILQDYNYTLRTADHGVEVWALGLGDQRRSSTTVAAHGPAVAPRSGSSAAVPAPASAQGALPAGSAASNRGAALAANNPPISSADLTRVFGANVRSLQMPEENLRVFMQRASRMRKFD